MIRRINMPQVMRQPAIIWSAIQAKFGHIGAWRRRVMLVAIACLWPFLAGFFLAGAATDTLGAGAVIYDTRDPISLSDLLGKAVFSSNNSAN